MISRQMADAARRTSADLEVLFITGHAENAVLGHGTWSPACMSSPNCLLWRRIKDLIEAKA